MADIIRIPGGVNITTGVGDQLDITVTVKQNNVAVDIRGWQLEVTNCTLTLSDPENGEIRLGFTSQFPTLSQWVLRRAASPAKRLLAGYVQYITAAGTSTPGDVIEVTLEDAPDVVLEIADFVTGISIPPGGAQYALLEKASAGNFDTQWTSKPTVRGVRFDTANAATLAQAGDLGWDDLDQALAYRTNGITVDIAQENLVYVRNPPGNTAIPKGAVVAVKGASSNRLEVQLCDATAGSNLGCRTLGVAMGTISSPGFGFVSTFGLLRGFNTGSIVGGGVTEGSELFISSTPGVMSTQSQASPGRRVTVGYVVTTGTQGSIFVTVRRGLAVNELDNVLAASPAAGDVLAYSTVNGRWELSSDAKTALQPEDIDTLAELNNLLTDATLIDTADARLSDARTPTAHKASHQTGGSDALTPADIGAATSAQGSLANSAVQPGDLATVATSGAYSDLSGLPTLGTAAAQDSTAFATSAQGSLADSAVQPARQVATGTGLTGGGDLSADRTLALANTTVVAGSYGSATQSSTFTVDAQGRITSAASATITPSFASVTSTPTTLSGYGITDAVPDSRQITAGTGMTGGGNLSADRTLALSTASQASLALADTAVQPATLNAVSVKVGTKPNEVPANGYLGALAYQDTPYLTLSARPIVPLTTPAVQDVIDALLALGLIRQED